MYVHLGLCHGTGAPLGWEGPLTHSPLRWGGEREGQGVCCTSELGLIPAKQLAIWCWWWQETRHKPWVSELSGSLQKKKNADSSGPPWEERPCFCDSKRKETPVMPPQHLSSLFNCLIKHKRNGLLPPINAHRVFLNRHFDCPVSLPPYLLWQIHSCYNFIAVIIVLYWWCTDLVPQCGQGKGLCDKEPSLSPPTPCPWTTSLTFIFKLQLCFSPCWHGLWQKHRD